MSDQLERNKQAAMDFYNLMFNQCKPADAIQRYAGDVYIQHNPHVADGKQAFIDYFERPVYTQKNRHATTWCTKKSALDFLPLQFSVVGNKWFQ